ncbi:12414_t:CDS:2, partial [Funneliformis caledonium]
RSSSSSTTSSYKCEHQSRHAWGTTEHEEPSFIIARVRKQYSSPPHHNFHHLDINEDFNRYYAPWSNKNEFEIALNKLDRYYQNLFYSKCYEPFIPIVYEPSPISYDRSKFATFKLIQRVQANRPETIQTLLKYEKRPGQAQRFFARINKDFRWPSSMPEYLRKSAFYDIAEDGPDFDAEIGFNIIFFYNALDRGEFIGHENEWVTVYKQKVLECGQRYDDDKLTSVLDAMPSAVQIPVDQTRLPRGPPTKMVTVYRTNNGNDYKVRVRVRRPNESLIALLPHDFIDVQDNNKMYSCVVDTGAPHTILPHYVKKTLGRKGWSTLKATAVGYGEPTEQYFASQMFEVSIGDNYNWSKWVQAKIGVWDICPGDKVQYALVGNDVSDQMAYIHEPGKPLKI